jgi:signal transduction histidine kinase
MRRWLRAKGRGVIAFLLITALVLGGLAWLTPTALRMEEERLHARAEGEMYGKLRVALWRLDGRIAPVLAREDSRPYNYYSAVFANATTLRNDGTLYPPGTVLQPSPLLSAELPNWILLHFQADEQTGVASPQVLSRPLMQRLNNDVVQVPLTNVTPARAQLLARLSDRLTTDRLLPSLGTLSSQPVIADTTLLVANSEVGNYNADQQSVQPQQAQNPGIYMNVQEFQKRYNTRNQVQEDNRSQVAQDDLNVLWGNTCRNGEDWFFRTRVRPPRGEAAAVNLQALIPLWLREEGQDDLLVMARPVKIGERNVCQGIVLDWPQLQQLLVEDVADLFPAAQILPVHSSLPPHPERTMSALPLELDPGPLETIVPDPGRTPLRVSLALAWAAACVALLAVGLGGWSLLELSERRIRFVSAVTHELRTPMTTLRLYLDMLTGGLVKDEQQRAEYLQTLNAETDRLNRLVGNVLDFSRLENQRPKLERTPIALRALLEEVGADWSERCRTFGKELVIEDTTGGDLVLCTDAGLMGQVLGNLIDTACKYSRAAADPRIWVRARREGARKLVLEVEDRGPGVPVRERRSIFRPFQRGGGADVTAGGVGLGLALVRRWLKLLGGRLDLCPAKPQGACFRVELPV